jgi:hypothetical protein
MEANIAASMAASMEANIIINVDKVLPAMTLQLWAAQESTMG